MRKRVEAVWGGMFLRQLVKIGREHGTAVSAMRHVWDLFEDALRREPDQGWTSHAGLLPDADQEIGNKPELRYTGIGVGSLSRPCAQKRSDPRMSLWCCYAVAVSWSLTDRSRGGRAKRFASVATVRNIRGSCVSGST